MEKQKVPTDHRCQKASFDPSKPLLKYAEQGMEINPANLEFTYSKALIYADMGEVTKSVELLEELIEAPDGYYRALAYTKLGKLYRLDGFKGKAIESYRHALQEIEAELEGLRKWQGKKVSREKHAWFTERYGVLQELYGEVVEALRWLES